VKSLIYKELAAANTNTAENIENKREELNIIDRAGKTEMAEMTRAVVICLTAAAARLSII
jgi:hypothetical protein